MPAFAGRVERLPEVFPVFPLAGVLLLPGGKLPLNIFEPRYLALTEDALAAGRLFGMVQPDASRPAGAQGPAVYPVGCLGRIVSFAETDDGRYLITLTGLSRFTIAAEAAMCRGYRRFHADAAAFAEDAAPGDPVFDRAAMLAELRPFFAARRIDANWEVISRMTDSELVTTLSMVCPFQPAEKQALLEAPSPTDRATVLLALLRMDAYAPRSETPPGRAS
ncbi:MAG: LON peptidase substrate-binding domain-containing protein [Alphaproteobacteria bacterium]|nr:LON peptidase substrate-binding domain-containing protein [Alphaproteobacteria bacterium]